MVPATRNDPPIQGHDRRRVHRNRHAQEPKEVQPRPPHFQEGGHQQPKRYRKSNTNFEFRP